MAALSFPRFPILLPNSLSPRTPRCRRSFSAPATASSAQTSRGGGCSAVLWFKQDLRLDDHPGLVQAAKSPALVPLYVFDRRILSFYSEEMLELVIFALDDLRKSLKGQGSNLMIRFGSSENVITDVVQEVKAANVFAEEEAEYHLRKVMDIVDETLAQTPFLDGTPRILRWQAPFYDINNLKGLPTFYPDFKKLQLPVTSPVPIPTLSGIELELEWGSLPTLEDVKKFINQSPFKLNAGWTLMEMSTATILQKILSESRQVNCRDLTFKDSQRKRRDKSVFVTQKGNTVGGGTSSVLNGLAAYLRYLEGTARDDWQEVHDRLRDAESRDGASFFSLFGPALWLGILSRRRLYHEAINYEKERNAGFLSPFGYSTATVAAAADAVCSMEWYWLMALRGQISGKGAYSIRIWRWKGHLIQYTVVGDEGPAILLVHGFGAFLEHYRDNIHGISEGGNRAWAITILGFGKSEKPNVVYTELLWAELLRDFICEVVGEPVHLVGNSIGGYFVAILARFWPGLVKSVILVNSAGDVIPGYGYLQFCQSISEIVQERQTSGTTWLGARLLLFYLRLNLRSIVKSCYPTKPERVDDWLINEMLRASHDPGVLVVLESIFSVNLSLPLNHLLEGLERKVLVVQGMRDPISDSNSKVAMLKEHCSGFMVREINAGHCPHDEQPQEINSIICEWIAMAESKLMARSISSPVDNS